MRLTRFATLALAATALLAPACKEDGGTGSNPTVLVFIGTVSGDDGIFSGAITFTVNGTTVTGQLDVTSPAAATHALNGTYNTGSKALAATGGGYTFGGVYDGVDRLEGVMSGNADGTFVTTKDDNSAQSFCGTFTGTDDGTFNFVIDGTDLLGTATTTSGTVIPLDGTVSGNAITIQMPGGGGTLASGTRSGNSVSGTWNDGVGGSGTWTGTRCN
jgi:hypothetical protein